MKWEKGKQLEAEAQETIPIGQERQEYSCKLMVPRDEEKLEDKSCNKSVLWSSGREKTEFNPLLEYFI